MKQPLFSTTCLLLLGAIYLSATITMPWLHSCADDADHHHGVTDEAVPPPLLVHPDHAPRVMGHGHAHDCLSCVFAHSGKSAQGAAYVILSYPHQRQSALVLEALFVPTETNTTHSIRPPPCAPMQG